MSDSNWISIIGMATGVTGAILGLVSFLRTGRYKRQDLRIQLRKASRELQSIIEKCDDILPTAKRSRERTARANGEATGNVLAWTQRYEKEFSIYQDAKNNTPSRGERFKKLSDDDIEDRLVEVESLKTTIKEILKRYEESLSYDRKISEKIMDRAVERHKQ